MNKINIKSANMCICGHEHNRHNDNVYKIFTEWGTRDCTLCGCKEFEPKYPDLFLPKEKCRHSKLILNSKFECVCLKCGKVVDKVYKIDFTLKEK